MTHVQVNNILAQRSVITRCHDLTALISTVSVEELRPSFQTIVENIFGFVNYVGWGLRNTTRQNLPKEAEAIFKFLAPDGPFIELTYRLMADQALKYEFPIKCLPVSVERQICKGEIIPFLSNKLPAFYSSSPGPKSLLLNAFEYYFCMFAFLQLSSSAECNSYLIGWGNLSDTVYTSLLEEYLVYFLPCNGRGVPTVEFNFRQIPDISFVTSHVNPRGQLTVASGALDKMRPKLFKPLVFQDQLVGTTQREPLFHSVIPAIQKEIWRTDCVLNMLILLWMNVDVPTNTYSLQYETVLPNVELIKAVRILVRHLHYFINSVSNHVMHPLDDIKRSTFPVFQKKLYVLLRYLLARWPLDNSFRIVYETWLSYIQPWRYVQFQRLGCTRPGGREREDIQIDTKWYNFILENILFYTFLFQQMIPRLERVELVAVRNSHMLFRVAKVFSQHDSLKRMLKDVERTLQIDSSRGLIISGPDSYLHSMLGNSSASSQSLGSTIYLHSPSKRSNGSLSQPSRNSGGMTTFGGDSPTSGITIAQVQHHMRELENPNFVYQPLFSPVNREKAINLVLLINQAKEIVFELIQKSEDKIRTPVSLYDKLFRNGSTISSPRQCTSDLAEKNRTINLLDQSRIALSRMFDIPTLDITDSIMEVSSGESLEGSSTSLRQGTFKSFTSLFSRSSTGSISRPDQFPIFPRGKYNVEMIKPLGNPDLSPIRGDEQQFLIHFLVSFSLCLNQYCVPVIERLYYRDNLPGKLSRAFFAKPAYYMEQEKRGPGLVTRVKKYLPPRINLRFMGSVYFVGLIFGILLLGFLFGVSGSGWIFWPIMGYIFYGILRASTEPQHFLTDLLREFGPIELPENLHLASDPSLENNMVIEEDD